MPRRNQGFAECGDYLWINRVKREREVTPLLVFVVVEDARDISRCMRCNFMKADCWRAPVKVGAQLVT